MASFFEVAVGAVLALAVGCHSPSDTGTTDTGTPATFQITSHDPGQDAADVAVDATVDVTFSAAVDANTVTSGSVFLADGSTTVPSTVSVSGTDVSLVPDQGLSYDTTYTVTVQATVTDTGGHPLAQPDSWSFTTVSPPPLTVVSIAPTDNATGAALDSTVSVTFSQPIDPSSLQSDSVSVQTSGGTQVYGTTSSNDDTVTFTPDSALVPETTYDVTVAGSIADTDGTALGTAYTSQFATLSFLHLVSISPSDGATGVRIDAPLVLTFDANVDPTTTAGAIEVTANTWVANQYQPTLSGTATVSGTQVTFVPDAGAWQEYTTGYTVHVNSTLLGTGGQPADWNAADTTFTTVFLDPAYYYRMHVLALGRDLSLDTFADTYEAEMEQSSSNTSGMLWYFEQATQGYWDLRNQYGGDALYLEGGPASSDSSHNLAALSGPDGNGNPYTGQLWKFVWYSARELNDPQGLGESPAYYYLENMNLGSSLALTTYYDGTYELADMEPVAGLTHQLWWFQRWSAR